MISSASVFTLLFVSAFALANADFCDDAYDKCDFRFAGSTKVEYYKITSSDMTFTPRIRSKTFGMVLGHMNANYKSTEIVFQKRTFPISNFQNPPFAPTQFKPYRFKKSSGSAIGAQYMTKSQKMYVNFRCIRVFFSSYQVLRKDQKTVKKNLHYVKNGDNTKCVVFRVLKE